MKKLITAMFLVFSANVLLNAQATSNSTASVASTTKKPITYSGDSNSAKMSLSYPYATYDSEADSSKNKYTFQYLVGSSKVNGYSMHIQTYSTTNVAEVTTFKNGKSAPILQVYVNNKSQYTGGILEDNNGKKTTISDIKLEEKDSTLIFTVVGKEFSMSFNLNNGAILKEDESVSVFYTEKIGAWKIYKKK